MAPNPEPRAGDKPFAVIFGAAGLAGRHLVKRLADRGFKGLCLSRRAPPAPYEVPPGFSWATLGKDLALPAATVWFSLAPISALPALMADLAGAWPRRLLALSTSGLLFKAASPDPRERDLARDLERAEKATRLFCEARGIVWTLFRPTLIYDPGRDRNISAIVFFIRRFRFFPIIRPGAGLRQPLHADDAAQALVAAIDAPQARDALFDLPGGETLSYREMICRCFESLGRRPRLMELPPGFPRAALRLGLTRAARLERMNAALTLDPAPVRNALGLTGRPFRPEFPPPERGED